MDCSLRDASTPTAGTGRHTFCGGLLSGMRGRLFFEPLAIFMAFLMAAPYPSASAQSPARPPESRADVTQERLAEPGSTARSSDSADPLTPRQEGPAAAVLPDRGTAPLQPRLSSNCTYLGGNTIIQLVCAGNSLSSGSAPSSDLTNAIVQFESDSIKQWLGLLGLPNSNSDVSTFYQYARTSLRNDLRAYMKIRLIDIGYRLNNHGTVSGNEQTVWSWFRDRVQARKVAMDQDAVNDKNSWQSNRCGWKPDQDLENVFGFNYIPCVGTQIFNTAPSKDYFIAAAKKRNYDNVLLGLVSSAAPHAISGGALPASALAPRSSSSSSSPTPSGPVLFNGQDDASGHMLGIIGGVTGGVLGAAVVTTIVLTAIPKTRYAIFPNRLKSETRAKLRANKVSNNETVEEDLSDAAGEAETEGLAEADTAIAGDADELAIAATAETTGEFIFEDGAAEGAAAGIAETIGDGAAAGAGGGPVGVLIGVGIAAAIVVTTIVVDESIAEKTLGDLDATLSADKANPPDLAAMQKDALGQYQLGVSWTEITWPDVPSNAALPAPGPANLSIASWPAIPGTGNPTMNTVSYNDWFGASWTIAVSGGYFVGNGTLPIPSQLQSKFSISQATIPMADINTTIDYLDWSFTPRWATRIGLVFVVGKQFPADTDVDCPADATGVTEMADVSGCRTYVTSTPQVLANNPDGTHYQAFISMATAPAFSPSNNTINFNTNEGVQDFPIGASGYPAPTISVDPSTPLPAGITLITYNVPGANTGVAFELNKEFVVPNTYSVILHAKNAGFDTTSTVSFNVTGPDYAMPPAFDDTALATQNQRWNWLTGVPVDLQFHVLSANNLTFSTNFPLPDGLTFSNNGNVARISGTPQAQGGVDKGTFYTPAITACDPFNRCASLTVTYFVAQAPAAKLNVPDPNNIILNFPANQFNQYTLTTSGAVTPVSFSTCFAPLPNWLTMKDNGNGSVTFSGTAPTASGASVVNETSLIVNTAGVQDQSNVVGGPCSHNNMQIFSDGTPHIYNGTPLTVTVGQNFGLFLQTSLADGGTISTTSPLPNGVSFLPPFGTGGSYSIGGNAQPGSGGDYRITFTLTNPGLPAVQQDFLLTVNEPPSFNLPSTIFLMVGVPGQFIVHPGGHPGLTAMSVKQLEPLPTGVIFGSVTALTAMAGNGTLKGTPDPSTAKTSWPLLFTANNGVGSTAFGNTILHISPAGDVTRDDVVNCTDVAFVKSVYGTKAGSAKYNALADVNGDGIINILDLNFVTSHLPAGTVCH